MQISKSSHSTPECNSSSYASTNIPSTSRPRLVRIVSPTNASFHDLLLIDSPKFHFVLDFALNVEVYHLTIRGANLGSYDGIDAIGTNYYIHDNEVGYLDTGEWRADYL